MEELNKENLIYVDLDDDLKTVLACFRVNQISHVPVMSEGRMVGMIAKTDVVEFLHDHLEKYNTETLQSFLTSVKAKEVMVQPLVRASVQDSQKDLLEKLIQHQVSSVVICDESNKVVGIVTESDLLQYIASKDGKELSFAEKLELDIVQWLDKNGIIKVSRALADIGI